MSINSISPVDGRYESKTKELKKFFSEKALIKYRIFTEINYLIHLAGYKGLNLRNITNEEKKYLSGICNINDDDAEIVKKIETIGYEDIPATNHDVKAIEYYIKIKIKTSSLNDISEMVHFALTSEDINNISHALMIAEGFNKGVFPKLIEIYETLYNFAFDYKDAPMLARTHGQPASPTTFGKEMLVFVSRIKEEINLLKDIPLLVKLNGATGNYNAHHAVYNDIDWQSFSEKLINEIKKQIRFDNNHKYYTREPLQLKHNRITIQIEPHDGLARVFDSVKRLNTILVDFCQDIWRYISDGWIKQKAVKGEIGSSAMPHKVNPIDFENAEGNLGIANSLFSFFSSKLSISRLQRDLSDSTVLRNAGVAFSHSLIAYKSILKGLSKIKLDEGIILKELQDTPEVIAEAYQNILRMQGIDKPYELLKDITRGKNVKLEDFYSLVDKIDIDKKTKDKLLNIKPENYTGIASKIVEEYNPKIY